MDDQTRGNQSTRRARFDVFADRASQVTGQAWFFAVCVGTVVIWAPSYFAFGKVNTWQLVINSFTTIVTFLLVALLQNTQRRGDLAMQQKLDAIAQGLADLMEDQSRGEGELAGDCRELREAVGLEERVSA